MPLTEQTQRKLLESSRRWFVPPKQVLAHRTISDYRTEQIRFKTAHAGRRSYKTEYAKRHLVKKAMERPNQNLFLGAPTREHVKRIFWPDLKELASPLIVDKSETELWAKLISGSTIYCVGFDKAERFDGTIWHGGVLDEYGDMKPEVWGEHVYPALMDTGGWCWLIGVPAGKNHYYELIEAAKERHDPNWKDYCWLSADVMSSEEIDAAKQTMDARTFRQELEGSFESWDGRAFVYYDSSVHRRATAFDSRYPLDVACDFNLDPCIWQLCQDRAGTIVGIDEIVQHRTDLWKMGLELKERLSKYAPRVLRFFGDYQHGATRSVSAIASSWEILRSQFPYAEQLIRPNPRILDGVSAVNSKLRNVRGDVQFILDPKCLEAHKDFEQVTMQQILDREEGEQRGHASSCFRYYVNFLYPIISQSKWKVK